MIMEGLSVIVDNTKLPKWLRAVLMTILCGIPGGAAGAVFAICLKSRDIVGMILLGLPLLFILALWIYFLRKIFKSGRNK